MTHLSDEQLEGVLAGTAGEPAHLGECPQCRQRLADQRAVRARLQSAFDDVHAGEHLAARIRASLGDAGAAAPDRRRVIRLRWLAPLSAVAAVLILAVPLAVYMLTPASAEAQLVEIHRHNLSPHREFFTDAEPEKLAAYMKDRLGFSPRMPQLGAGMAIRGCCVAHFRSKPVGSYVVDTPRGAISIIVVAERPEDIGMKRTIRRGQRTFGAGDFARCNMVTAQLDGYTYCAVGEVPPDLLADLLARLMP